MSLSPDALERSINILRKEAPRKGSIAEPMELSRLTKSIFGGIQSHALETVIVVFTAVVLVSAAIRGHSNFDDKLEKAAVPVSTTSVGGDQNSSVYRPGAYTDALWQLWEDSQVDPDSK